MSIFANLLKSEQRTATVSISDLKNPNYWLLNAFGGDTTASSRNVSPSSALQTVAVFACVNLISSTIASLPFPVYKRLVGGGKERDYTHPLYDLLHNKPNPEMTSYEWRQATTGHRELWGNAYSNIEWDDAGKVKALWPLRPDCMVVKRSERTGELVYVYTMPDGEQRGLLADEVMHLKGFGTDGMMGLSPISMARESIGMGMAAEEYGARFFGNDSRPGGILKSPNKMTPADASKLKESWESVHGGLSNRHRVAVLENGIEWQQIGIPPRDAQFLELRQFQRSEIPMLFGIPPHMIGDTDKVTSWGSGIEQLSVGFVTYSLRSRLVSFEQRVMLDLMTDTERQTWFVEFLVDGLLRGDATSRSQALAIRRQNGVLNADEWREIENMNPLPNGEGKVFLVNSAMISPTQAASPDKGATE
jgi:HK97 family phage portal protein